MNLWEIVGRVLRARVGRYREGRIAVKFRSLYRPGRLESLGTLTPAVLCWPVVEAGRQAAPVLGGLVWVAVGVGMALLAALAAGLLFACRAQVRPARAGVRQMHALQDLWPSVAELAVLTLGFAAVASAGWAGWLALPVIVVAACGSYAGWGEARGWSNNLPVELQRAWGAVLCGVAVVAMHLLH